MEKLVFFRPSKIILIISCQYGSNRSCWTYRTISFKNIPQVVGKKKNLVQSIGWNFRNSRYHVLRPFFRVDRYDLYIDIRNNRQSILFNWICFRGIKPSLPRGKNQSKSKSYFALYNRHCFELHPNICSLFAILFCHALMRQISLNQSPKKEIALVHFL